MIQLGYFSKGESVCFCRSLRKLLQSTSEGTSRLGCTTLRSDFFPVENEAFPGGYEAFPVEHKAFPGRNEAFSVGNEALDIEKGARLDLSSFADMYENNAASFNARQIVLTEYPMRINCASGCMDDFCVYGRALREGEIVTLCNMGG